MASATRAVLRATGFRIPLVSAKSITDPSEQIERRAFELFSAHKDEPGRLADDWYRAEDELLRPVPLEIMEDDDSVLIRANVLGFWGDELKVAVEDHLVTIAGKKAPQPQFGNKVTYIEWSPDAIFKRVELPMGIMPETATAMFDGGWLEITIQRATSSWSEGVPTCQEAEP